MNAKENGDPPLEEYLPENQNGSILITSRNKGEAQKLVDSRDVIEVSMMDEATAVLLFEKKMGRRLETQDVIVELVSELGFLPLAIVQAASLMRKRGDRFSVRRYLDAFRKNDEMKVGLLKYDDGARELRRDRERPIFITLQMSLSYLQERRPSAAKLLSVMSFFDGQGITESLFHEQSGLDLAFDDDVQELQDYSLISRMDVHTAFSMHRLVQVATRDWLKKHDQLEKPKKQFINILSSRFPKGSYENWAVCRPLFPHILSAVKHNEDQPFPEETMLQWASLLNNASVYARTIGAMKDSEKMASQSMNARNMILGPEHPDALSSMNSLANTYLDQGRYEEAEKFRVQVLEAQKRILGPEHPHTLSNMGYLAITYQNQGRYEEAEKLNVQVLEVEKRILGPEHPHTLMSMNNLASTYWNQGRYKEAKKLYVQVVEARKRILGPEHPSTLSSVSNLAITYSHQGRYDETKKLYVQVLEGQKRILGPEHPSTLKSKNNLAYTYGSQGRYKEAEKLCVKVLEAQKRILGPDHPDTLMSMNNMAITRREPKDDGRKQKSWRARFRRHAKAFLDSFEPSS